jgi:hypothetical protein
MLPAIGRTLAIIVGFIPLVAQAQVSKSVGTNPAATQSKPTMRVLKPGEMVGIFRQPNAKSIPNDQVTSKNRKLEPGEMVGIFREPKSKTIPANDVTKKNRTLKPGEMPGVFREPR